jgi:hypothetical protein
MLRSLIKLRAVALLSAGLIPVIPEGLVGQALGTPVIPVRYSIRVSDALVFGGGAVAAAIPALAGTSLPYARCAPCDSTSLWGIDRHTIGLPKGNISDLSTATMGLTALGGAALVALSRHGEPQANRAALEDLVVMAETMDIDAAAVQWAKVLFHRARPVLYTSAYAQNQTVDAGRSFPSGHASFSFAAAVAAASILERRHQLGAHKGEVALLVVGAALTSTLRVVAHKHFPTDVVAGAALGSAIGWIYPQIHRVQ